MIIRFLAFLVFTTLEFVVSLSTISFQTHVETSLHHCQQAATMFIERKHGVNLNANPFLTSSLLTLYMCVGKHWQSCVKPQPAPLRERKYTISRRPCRLVSLYFADQDFTLNIQAHHKYQLMLTFKSFWLEHQRAQCKHHYVEVRNIAMNHNVS